MMDEPFDQIKPLQDIGQLVEEFERKVIDPGDPPGGSTVPARTDQPLPPRSGGNQSALPPTPQRPETT